jgi:hypothetical protein
MTVCVFVGPTLRPEEVTNICDAICLPPVAQGDVYRAGRPQAIGIIDGYFSGTQSVWHKEILWAMSQGVHVFGSASMGALRAAELYRFGMHGVGDIFASFRDGILEDDDEVAVAHGPAETGFVPVSEPMVNIRATLVQARLEGIVSAPSQQRILHVAKSLFFSDRTWPRIFEIAAKNTYQGELTALAEWLPLGRVDQKRDDALAMLRAIQDTVSGGTQHQPIFSFTCTRLWERFVTESAWKGAPSSAAQAGLQRILEELRLEGPENYIPVVRGALLRWLSETAAASKALNISRDQFRAAAHRFRSERALFTHKALRDWQLQNDISAELFEQLVEGETRVELLADTLLRVIQPHLLDELRLSGRYPRLAKRAQSKQASLTEPYLTMSDVSSDSIGTIERRVWYFESRFGNSPPDDINSWILRAGFDNISEFDTAVSREWKLRHLTGNKTT